MIKQIGLPLRGRPILLITRMITDRIGLHSVLLPLLINMAAVQKFEIKMSKFCIICSVRAEVLKITYKTKENTNLSLSVFALLSLVEFQ